MNQDWNLYCPINGCQEKLVPCQTDEDKPLFPNSVYAITKRDQEELFLTIGNAYSIPTVALRYFNVYGTRQALRNPYTGVCGIFSTRILNKKPPVIFEDGFQSRDFIHVSDIVQANMIAMDNYNIEGSVFNVGTGQAITVLEVAETLKKHLEFIQPPKVTGQFRAGDIRNCYASIQRLTSIGYLPKIQFSKGIREFIDWARTHHLIDNFEQALQELEFQGLVN